MNIARARNLTQVFSFILSNLGFDIAFKTGIPCPFFYCYGCPYATFACPIGTLQHFVIFPAFPLYLLGAIGMLGVAFGRFFCGWACPFGALHDLLAYINKARNRKLRSFTYSKFLMLFIVLLAAWFTVDTFFCKFCPSGSLWAALPSAVVYPQLNFGLFFYVHIVTLVVTVCFGLMIARFWCRYLCPFAPIGIFNRISLATVSLDHDQCSECNKCLESCPMSIQKVEEVGRSSDCIGCGRCVEVCQTKALKIGIRR